MTKKTDQQLVRFFLRNLPGEKPSVRLAINRI